jgi:hypothetical protein
MSDQRNRISVNLTKHNAIEMGSLVIFDTILKSVLSATFDELSRHDVIDLFKG